MCFCSRLGVVYLYSLSINLFLSLYLLFSRSVPFLLSFFSQFLFFFSFCLYSSYQHVTFPSIFFLSFIHLFVFSRSIPFHTVYSFHSILSAPPNHILPCPGLSHTFSADGDELDSLAGDEVESFVDVGDLVEPHLAAVWLRESLAGDDLPGTRS